MRMLGRLGVLLAGMFLAWPALADDTLRIAVGQRGLWDTSVAELGQRGGIFKKHGIALDILYTQGGGETQQAVISGSVELGVAAGIIGRVRRLFEGRAGPHHRRRDDRGAPTCSGTCTAASPIKIAAGHRRQDHRLFDQRVLDARRRHRLHQAIRPQGQAGRDRQSALDPDAGDVRPDRRRLVGAAVRPRPDRAGQDPHHRHRQRRAASRTRRCGCSITNARPCRRASAVLERFMRAYRETMDWMYADPAVFKALCAISWGSPRRPGARRATASIPKAALDPDAIVGVDAINTDAVAFKYTAAPLTQARSLPS